jgi:Domain of unknown function (DUF4440)
MSVRLSSIVLIVLLLCSFGNWHSVKATGNNSDPEAALLQLEKSWLAAENDPDVLDSILADDFIHVLPGGFVTKKEQLSYMRSHPSPKRETKHFEDLRVRIFGSAGVVNGIVVATDADSKTRRTIFTDMFAYRGGRWQAVNAQELPLGK